jgi:hypothetical protein
MRRASPCGHASKSESAPPSGAAADGSPCDAFEASRAHARPRRTPFVICTARQPRPGHGHRTVSGESQDGRTTELQAGAGLGTGAAHQVPNKPDQWRLSSPHNGARLHPEASRSRDLLRHSHGRSPSDPCAHREGHLQPRAAAPMACGGLCARAAARAAGMEFVTLNELPGIISDGIRPDRKKITAARG